MFVLFWKGGKGLILALGLLDVLLGAHSWLLFPSTPDFRVNPKQTLNPGLSQAVNVQCSTIPKALITGSVSEV